MSVSDEGMASTEESNHFPGNYITMSKRFYGLATDFRNWEGIG